MAYRMLIDGRLVEGAGRIAVINPATGTAFAEAPRADEEMLNLAISGAKAAFPTWAAMEWEERRALLLRFADAIESRRDEMVRLLTMEQGKPLQQASGEVAAAIGTLRYNASLELPLETLRETDEGRILAQRFPLGVVAAITPWNFPVLLMMIKIAPALLAGNCVIAKPAPTTPLTTLLLGEIAADILPKGTLSVIVDQNDLGAALTSHPDIAKVSFTGSTQTGKKVMQATADSLKRITLELGGNDAAIVLEDVDVEAIAPHILNSVILNSGQVCLATKRIYAHRSIYEDLCQALARLAEEVVVDDGLQQGTQIGPIQNRQQFDKLRDLLADAHVNGTVIAGGEALDRPGYFIPPTIVRDIPETARLVKEEQFGPIVPVLPFDEEDEVIERANATEYGLGGTIWTADQDRGLRLALKVVTGTLWINDHMKLPADVPIGGAKQSGIGLQQGIEGLEEYTQLKIIHCRDLPTTA